MYPWPRPRRTPRPNDRGPARAGCALSEAWRNAGVVCGEYAKYDGGPEVITLMFDTWSRYIQLSDELDPADKGAEEIKRICKDRVNPYTGVFYGEDGRPAERS